MASVNNQEFMAENHPQHPQHSQPVGHAASVTPEGSAAQVQETPLNVTPLQHEPYVPEDPLVVPQIPPGAPMKVVMAALVNTINCQGQLLREQTEHMRGQNEQLHDQSCRIQVAEHSRTTTRVSGRTHRRRSPTPENYHSKSRGIAGKCGGDNRPPPLSPIKGSPNSDDERHRGPLSRRIMDIPLPRGLEKPSSLDKYDGTDPEEHIQSVEVARDYRSVHGSIKSKLFPLTLMRGASTCSSQGPEESLRSYIKRFNIIAVEVDTSDKMKLYLLEVGLRKGTEFQKAVGIDEFFVRAHKYIQWEEKQKATQVRRPKNPDEAGPKSQFTHYTPLIARRDRILAEISSVDFKKAGIRFPKQLPAKPNVVSPKKETREDDKVVDVVYALSRPEDFLPRQDNSEKEALEYLSAHLDGSWENFPGAVVISRGGFNSVTLGFVKRKFDKLEKVCPIGEIKITEVKEGSIPLHSTERKSPEDHPITKSHCWVSTEQPPNHGDTWTWSSPSGEDKATKSVKVKFLVVDCPSLYNCIIGRPTLAELFAVSSTIHLKLKNYTKKKKGDGELPDVNSITSGDAVELDARTSKKEHKEEKKAKKDDLAIKENYRPIPDEEFEVVPLGEEPAKGIKIEADLIDLVKRQLKGCLKENAELFALSAAEMPEIDPEVACH
ncbi:hypothetical protein TSUD_136270 [Trifolium subterraneum]|uniref:Retrotransposon gag domain-containing protein n=1 Tax=Trifolium subterraneum TaxID=3900 RepID=A0A2Z6P5Z5_TRISU|nr:hypothetical protein TSUD_136270 [Trifolium subterraneum]